MKSKSKTGRPASDFPNLHPFSREEARVQGVKGGKARWVKARERKSLAEELKNALNSTIQPSHPKYAEIKRMANTMGLGDLGDPTNQLLMVMGLLNRAQKDPAAFIAIRDTVGEKPIDRQEVSVNAPPVQIGIHDPSFVEAERAKIEAADESLAEDAEDDAPETPQNAPVAEDGEADDPNGETPPAAVSAPPLPIPPQPQKPMSEPPRRLAAVPIVMPRGRR